MSNWQPIETAPRDGKDVLLWDGEVVVVGNRMPDGKDWCVITPLWHGWTEDSDVYPTHWMPLPEPPEVKDDP